MPIQPTYQIGDIANHKDYGKALILGCCHQRSEFVQDSYGIGHFCNQNYYLAYFTDSNSVDYIPDNQILAKQSAATPDSLEQAQNMLLLFVNPNTCIWDTTAPNLTVGDIISHWNSDANRTTYTNETGYVLNDGLYLNHHADANVYYHVYYPRTGIFAFIRSKDTKLLKFTTPESYNKAHEIIRDEILMPAFS